MGSLGLPWGAERSIKLGPERLLGGRVLVGLPRQWLDDATARRLVEEIGIPAGGWELLADSLARSNAVFLGIEESPEGVVGKAYLEFWDEVRRQVRAEPGSMPRLLHLGVKWSDRRPGHFEVAQYHCHPLLSGRDVMRRMAGVYEGDVSSTACPLAQAVLRRGLQRAPTAGLLYEEVSEAGNPRRSWDVNLYKTGLLVRDAMPEFEAMGRHFGVDLGALSAALEPMQERLLGHLSGGVDRRGQEFVSVYAELRPMPVLVSSEA
jgi:hypothetical protein